MAKNLQTVVDNHIIVDMDAWLHSFIELKYRRQMSVNVLCCSRCCRHWYFERTVTRGRQDGLHWQTGDSSNSGSRRSGRILSKSTKGGMGNWVDQSLWSASGVWQGKCIVSVLVFEAYAMVCCCCVTACSHHQTRTRQDCLVLSSVVFTPPTRTRQDKTVLCCPCRWCEQVITHTVLYGSVLFHWVTGASAKLLVTVSTEAGSKAWPNAHPHCVFVCNVVNYALQLLSQHIVTLHICVIGKTSYLHI